MKKKIIAYPFQPLSLESQRLLRDCIERMETGEKRFPLDHACSPLRPDHGDNDFSSLPRILDPRGGKKPWTKLVAISDQKETSEITIKINDAPLLFPTNMPLNIRNWCLGDPEARLSYEAYVGEANCISYGLQSVIKKWERDWGSPIEWYDVFVSPFQVDDINKILLAYFEKVRMFSKGNEEAVEVFSSRLEEMILKDPEIKEGDILTIFNNDKYDGYQYSHFAILTKGDKKPFVLACKAGTTWPCIRTSIKIQVGHYIGGALESTVSIFRPLE